ncbi:MAG: hypothetical protein QGG40_15735, partial [Myxococcota bacterium]|nr:hypothetical protein [Myxococcota bacterium]
MLVALLVAVLSVALDPRGTPSTEALGRAAAGIGATVAWLIAVLGAGGALLGRACPGLLEDDRGIVHALVVGGLLW